MALDTVSLSDIGTSLLAIEAEVSANNASINYYKSQIGDLRDKNDALVKLSRELFKMNCPLTYGYSSKDLY